MGVERGEVPTGPGRDPAAKRRVLEGLRKVAQRQPLLAQLVLQHRPGGARLDPRRQRLRVDLQHPIQPPQVQRDNRPIPQPRLHPTDHARPAPERNDRGPLGLSPGEHHLDLRLVPRKRNEIRRVLEFPPEPPHHVPISLPQRARNPLVVVVREQVPEPPEPPTAPPAAPPPRAEPAPRPRPRTRAAPLSPPQPPRAPSGRRLVLVPPPPVLEPPLIDGNAPLEARDSPPREAPR